MSCVQFKYSNEPGGILHHTCYLEIRFPEKFCLIYMSCESPVSGLKRRDVRLPSSSSFVWFNSPNNQQLDPKTPVLVRPIHSYFADTRNKTRNTAVKGTAFFVLRGCARARRAAGSLTGHCLLRLRCRQQRRAVGRLHALMLTGRIELPRWQVLQKR